MNFREQMADQFAVVHDGIVEPETKPLDPQPDLAWLRQTALELAIKAYGSQYEADHLLKAAAKFEAYLLGKQES